jgi:hypothetical protein
MSGAPDLFERFATGLARALSFGAASGAVREGGVSDAGADRRDAPPAWPDEPGVSDREDEERLRELQILMATWM